MICFLEDHGETVLVSDLVHVRTKGGWSFERSAYPKLKMTSEWVRETLGRAGFAVDFERTERGVTVLAAAR
jgi:hypothetical protein